LTDTPSMCTFSHESLNLLETNLPSVWTVSCVSVYFAPGPCTFQDLAPSLESRKNSDINIEIDFNIKIILETCIIHIKFILTPN
jgi:hypothetical protein